VRDHLLSLLDEQASCELVNSIENISEALWKDAYALAKEAFIALLEEVRGHIPEALQDALVLEPRLSHAHPCHGQTEDICITLSEHVWSKHIANSLEQAEGASGQKNTRTGSQGITAEDRKSGELSQALYEHIRLDLAATTLHEMIHLLGKKTYTIDTSFAQRDKPREESESHSLKHIESARFRPVGTGNRVHIPSQHRWVGNALGELATISAEIILYRSKGSAVDLLRKKNNHFVMIRDILNEAQRPHLADILEICAQTRLFSLPGAVEIPTITIEDKHGRPSKLAYAHTYRVFLDLGREIFRSEIVETKDPYKTLFKKALISHCAGKPVLFFKDATFEGLELLSESEQKDELRKYRKFLMSVDFYPSKLDFVLLRAFVSAGVYQEGLTTVALRKQILALHRALAHSS
jgi:hypothetical protein